MLLLETQSVFGFPTEFLIEELNFPETLRAQHWE